MMYTLDNAVLEERVGDAEGDALAAAGDDGKFYREVGAFLEAELAGANLGGDASKVLGDGVLDGVQGGRFGKPRAFDRKSSDQ